MKDGLEYQSRLVMARKALGQLDGILSPLDDIFGLEIARKAFERECLVTLKKQFDAVLLKLKWRGEVANTSDDHSQVLLQSIDDEAFA